MKIANPYYSLTGSEALELSDFLAEKPTGRLAPLEERLAYAWTHFSDRCTSALILNDLHGALRAAAIANAARQHALRHDDTLNRRARLEAALDRQKTEALAAGD